MDAISRCVGILDVDRVVIERRQRADHADHDRHRMRVAAEAGVEPGHLLMHHGVLDDAVVERQVLLSRRQLAVEQQIAGLDKGKPGRGPLLLRQLHHGVRVDLAHEERVDRVLVAPPVRLVVVARLDDGPVRRNTAAQLPVAPQQVRMVPRRERDEAGVHVVLAAAERGGEREGLLPLGYPPVALVLDVGEHATFPASARSSTGSSRRVTSMSLSMITTVPSGSACGGTT